MHDCKKKGKQTKVLSKIHYWLDENAEKNYKNDPNLSIEQNFAKMKKIKDILMTEAEKKIELRFSKTLDKTLMQLKS